MKIARGSEVEEVYHKIPRQQQQFQRRLEACFEEVENDHDLSRLLSENDFSHLDPISVAQVYMSSPVFMCGNVEIRVCCACVELPSACMRVL